MFNDDLPKCSFLKLDTRRVRFQSDKEAHLQLEYLPVIDCCHQLCVNVSLNDKIDMFDMFDWD